MLVIAPKVFVIISTYFFAINIAFFVFHSYNHVILYAKSIICPFFNITSCRDFAYSSVLLQCFCKMIVDYASWYDTQKLLATMSISNSIVRFLILNTMRISYNFSIMLNICKGCSD